MLQHEDRIGITHAAALLAGFSVLSALLLGIAGIMTGVMAIALALLGRHREGDSLLASTALSCGALGVALAMVNYLTLFVITAGGHPGPLH